MDSLTQIALGAAVGEAVLGRRVGARAAAWGAVCGTIPDLDVLVPFTDAVADFTYHRSFSHSLFVLAALTPLMVWLILRAHPQTRDLRARWAVLVYGVFATHVVLDAFTIYGTQIFWPLDNTPVGLGSIFIIDPAYTLPLLIGVITALILRHSKTGMRFNHLGLGLSSGYLLWGLGASFHVENLAARSLDQQNIEYERLLATPTPFNSVLWRILAVDRNGYHVGYYSLLDADERIETRFYPSEAELIEPLEDEWAVRRLRWFTHGFYVVERERNDILISDLRMGLEPDYVFRFKVGEIDNPHPHSTDPTERVPGQRDMSRVNRLWARIFDQNTPSP